MWPTDVSGLSPGATHKVCLASYTTNDIGQQTARVCVDCSNVVSESNEGNNCRQESFSVRSAELIVTVRDQNNDPTQGAHVDLYSGGWSEWLDGGTTNSSGVISWPSLMIGAYCLEAYYNGELWASDCISLSCGTNPKTLKRNEPYAYAFSVFNSITGVEVTDSTVPGNTDLRYEVSVTNDHSDSRQVQVTLRVDQGQSSPYDFDETTQSVTIPGGGVHTFEFSDLQTEKGSYYRQLEVKSYLNNNYVKTDSWSWGSAYTIIDYSSASIVQFEPPTGNLQRGDQAQATVRVSNSGTTSKSFWVGLSFAEPWAIDEIPDPWPDGWYDIRPQVTNLLNPGDVQDIVFQFKIPPTLPAETYTARTAIWEGYDAERHLMSEPRYDVRDMQSFSLNDYLNPTGDLESQLLDIVSFVAFDEMPFGEMMERYRGVPGGKCEKVLLYFRLTADATLFGVPVMAGGSLLIDLADLFDVTPEGRDDKWVSVWIDAHGGVKMSATGINVSMGLSHHMFDYGEEALADYRKYISGEVSGQVGYIVFSGLGWDQGFQVPKLKIVTGFSISCEASGTWQELTSLEINKDKIKEALSHANGDDLHALSDAILDYFVKNVNNDFIRNKTEDDGNIRIENEQGDWTHDLRCDKTGYAHYFFTDINSRSEMRIVTANGAGDANLYVKSGERPTLTSYDYRSVVPQSNEESITIPSPSSDDPWYIMIYANKPYKGVNLSVRYDPTDVAEIESPALPATFSLSQNCPNPFNPETRIEFALPRASDVTIEVFNILGQRVTTLVSEHLSAGYKTVSWNGKDGTGAEVSSGMYFYRISASDFVESKKMLLLK